MMMRILALCAAVTLAATSVAYAGDVQVALDQSRPIRLPAAASGIVIGNPSVAGVSVQNNRLLFVTGRSYGSTNLIVVGENGRPIFESRITVIPDESNVVMLTRGVATTRFDCSPICRRRPDISDDQTAFTQTNEQITAHAGAAVAGQQ